MQGSSDNKLRDFLKKDTAFLIFVLTSAGTMLSFVIKGVELAYRYARYITLGIPLYFLSGGNSVNLLFTIVFIILTVSISVVLYIVFHSYIEKLRAYWIFDASFHTEKPPKIKHKMINMGYILLFLWVLLIINIPSVLFSVYNITLDLIPFLILLAVYIYAESMVAENIILLMKNDQENRPWKFNAYNEKDKQKELTQEDVEKINNEYLRHKSLLSFSNMKKLIMVSMILSLIFYGSYEIGKRSANNPNAIYQMISIEDKSYVILEKCDDLYVAASVTESYDGNRAVLNIENSNQLIIEMRSVKNYQMKSFDKVNLVKGSY